MINKPNLNEEYIQKNAEDISTKDLKKLNKKKKRLNKILNLKVFSKQKEKLKLLVEIVQNYQKGVYKTIPWRSIAAIIFTLLYIINPLDIIPDVLPFFGYIDDISVFMSLLKLVEIDIKKYKDWKTLQN